MSPLLEHIVQQCRPLAQQHIQVALSGGMDSVVLLHLLAQARQHIPFTLSALHIHHGLSPHADHWLNFCQQYAQQLNIPFQAQRVQVQPDKLGLEAAARAARYTVFAQQTSHIIALAHHADDQQETFLLAALRGSGIRALSAMPAWRELPRVSGSLKLWRPLLAYSKHSLEYYAQHHDLQWITDESNADTQYTRNFLRHEILPRLAQHNPHSNTQIQATITALQQDLCYLNEITAQDCQLIAPQGYFQIPTWRTLSPLRGNYALTHWVAAQQLGTPTRHALDEFAQQLRHSRQAKLQLPHGTLIAYRAILFTLPHTWQQSAFWLAKPISGSLKTLAEYGQDDAGKIPTQQSNQTIIIRAAHKNDRLPISPQHHQSVFKILAQNGVPAVLRPQWPILTNPQDRVLAIFNQRIAHDWTFGDWRPKLALLQAFSPPKNI